MSREDEIAAAVANNRAVVAENGFVARLDVRMQAHVIERDTDWGLIHLGGLGGMGVGTMWFRDEPGSDVWDHSSYPGYNDAPEAEAPDHDRFICNSDRWRAGHPGQEQPDPWGRTPEEVRAHDEMVASSPFPRASGVHQIPSGTHSAIWCEPGCPFYPPKDRR